MIKRKQERTVDVLAYRAEEGRRKRRNASGSRTQTTIRGVSEWGNPVMRKCVAIHN